MDARERLVDASCAGVSAARAGDLEAAYRAAWTMLSLIHEIEFHELLSLDLGAIADRVVWAERSCSSASAA